MLPEKITGTNTSSISPQSIESSDNGETKVKQTGANSSFVEKTDENTLVNTSVDENVTSEALEEELLRMQQIMETIEKSIESNEKIKETYQKRYETIKQQIESAKSRMKSARDEATQRCLQSTIFSLGLSLDMMSAQINAMNTIINGYSKKGSALNTKYSNTYSKYQNAVQAEQQAAMEAYLAQASQSNGGGSYTYADYAVGITGVSGVSKASNNSGVNTQPQASTGPASTNVSSRMLNQLKGWEGLRTEAYKCPAGVWTIGYGHTNGVKPGQKISEAQAENYLKQDLASFESQVTNLAKSVGVKLTQGQYDSLVSFAYNCGGGALKKSGIMEMLKGGNIDGAAAKMKEYCHGGGRVLKGLVNRRNIEASWLYT